MINLAGRYYQRINVSVSILALMWMCIQWKNAIKYLLLMFEIQAYSSFNCMHVLVFLIFWFEPVLLLVLASYCHYHDFNTIQIRLHVHAFLSLIKLYEHRSSNLTFKNFMKIILTSCWRVVTCGVTCTGTLFTFHFIGKGMFL